MLKVTSLASMTATRQPRPAPLSGAPLRSALETLARTCYRGIQAFGQPRKFAGTATAKRKTSRLKRHTANLELSGKKART